MNLYLSAAESAALLGVSKPTLYAYVSRGLIRSGSGRDSRSRRYNRLDLEALKGRKQVRSQPQIEVAGALNWGVPLLDSALTLILDGKLYYRGLEVNQLVDGRSFWEIAQWFWTGRWDYRVEAVPRKFKIRSKQAIGSIQNALIEESSRDPMGYDYTFPAVGETGSKILRLFLSGLIQRDDVDLNEAGRILQLVWCPRRPEAMRLLNAALILCIDHELNASSFTARVVAGADCNLYEVTSAALCALHGTRHGGDVLRAALLMDELVHAASVRQWVLQRARIGVEIPGFGHRLYPNGDPRAECLFRLLNEIYPNEMKSIERMISSASSILKRRPTIDLALAILVKVLRLPTEAGFYLFALGRAVGWIAHAVEQRCSNQMIRPRARYTGVMPG